MGRTFKSIRWSCHLLVHEVGLPLQGPPGQARAAGHGCCPYKKVTPLPSVTSAWLAQWLTAAGQTVDVVPSVESHAGQDCAAELAILYVTLEPFERGTL